MNIVRFDRAEIDLSELDWVALESVSDIDLDAQIAGDPVTAPVFTADELARARRVRPTRTA